MLSFFVVVLIFKFPYCVPHNVCICSAGFHMIAWAATDATFTQHCTTV